MMKSIKKLTVIATAVIMAFSAAACGSASSSKADESSKAESSVTVETQEWGNIKVFVPEGMTLKGGNALDDTNPDVLTITDNNDPMKYFLINVEDDEESAKSSIDITREVNEGVSDVSVEAGTTWTGVTYDFYDAPVFQVYGVINGRFVTIQCYGNAADSPTAKSVLGSIEVKAAE